MLMNIVFVGPPGSGKSTQAKLITQRLGIPHISTGEIIRQEIASGSQIGLEFKRLAPNIPDDMMIKLIRQRLADRDCSNGFILDGFPRSVSQAQELNRMLTLSGKPLNAVIELNTNANTVRDRIVSRGGTSGRDDDNLNSLEGRMQRYNDRTSPVLDYYRRQGILTTINGSLPVDQIAKKIEHVTN